MTSNRLLAIDDDPEIGSLFRRVAESSGFEVRTTEDPHTFKLLCRSFLPDVIALDLAIPKADGIELLRHLAEEGCGARILILSGFDGKVRQAAERLGEAHGLRMSGTIAKPFRPRQVRALLGSLAQGG